MSRNNGDILKALARHGEVIQTSLAKMEAELLTEISAVEKRLEAKITAVERRLGGEIRGLGRRVDRVERRLTSIEGALNDLKARADAHERRFRMIARCAVG